MFSIMPSCSLHVELLSKIERQTFELYSLEALSNEFVFLLFTELDGNYATKTFLYLSLVKAI